MANAVFSFDEYNFGRTQDEFGSMNKSYESTNGANEWKNNCFGGVDDWDGFYQLDQQQEQKTQLYKDFEVFDDQVWDKLSPPLQTYPKNISDIQHVSESKKLDQNTFAFTWLELLKKYDNERRNSGKFVDELSSDTNLAGLKLSTEETIRLAGARFIESGCQVVDIASMLDNPFRLSFSNFSDEDSENVELVESLLSSAEKVGYQQFEQASRLLNHCKFLSSATGNPVQRLVYYFSEALQDRIDHETGRILLKNSGKMLEMLDLKSASLACYQKIPFFKVASFTGIQAIAENVAGAKRVHLIDLEIRCGAHWPILMQALQSRQDCPLELFKITAIGATSKQLIEDTGKRLASFAESMNIPFSFKLIMVQDVLELKEDLFQLDPEEALAIYSDYLLMSLISKPNRLDSLMRVLRNINPSVMVVTEVEANNNSPSFANRFIEALFFYSAYFDCFDACVDQDDPTRMATELVFFHNGIRNMVTCEGAERWIRHVKIDVWRSFFARFGMVETELSSSSLYQASGVLKQFACGNSCKLYMNGKCLLIGWKGTPIHSVSVWKFPSQN